MKRGLVPYNVMRYAEPDFAPKGPAVATFIGSAIFGGGVLTATQFFIASVITSVAVTAISSWALAALAPKPKLDLSAIQALGGNASSGILINNREAAAPQDFIYGEARKGGTVIYDETTGSDNKYLHRIIALAGHEVEEIGSIYINDEIVSVDANGFVGGIWGNKIRIRKHKGNQTTADPVLVSESGQVDSTFVGNNIAYLYVRLEYDQDIFASGVPIITAVVKGKKVYDPRTGVTSYSNNAALCLRDYLTTNYGLNDSDVNDQAFSIAANECDELVTLAAGGTEKKYTINGVVRANESHGDVIEKMITACAGTLFWGMGDWDLVAGAYSSPVKTFTLSDLRGPITVQPRVNVRDNFNAVRGVFNDAAQDWITVDYPGVTSSVFQAEDGGEERPLDFELPFTTSAATAQRLAKLTLLRAREQISVEADFSLAAFDVEVGDIIRFTNERYGWDQKQFEIIGWRLATDDSGAIVVRLSLRETSEAAFDWNADETALISNNTTLPSITANLGIDNLTISGGGRTQSDGTFINTAIVSWDAAQNAFVEQYEVQWKPVADSSYSTTFTSNTSIELAPLVDGVEYVFRVRSVTARGNRGPFSTATFTGGGDSNAPALPTSISATGGFKYITVSWTNPSDADLNYVEVWENTNNSTAGAVLVGEIWGNQFVRTDLGLNETRFYFLRSVDFSGNTSGYTSGVSATTTYLDDPDFENGLRALFEDQGLYPIEDVDGLPASGLLNRKVFNRQDGKLYEWDGSAWVLVVSAAETEDLIGQITETQITDDAISTPKLKAGAVTATNIAAATITGDKISANTITGGLLATSGIITNSAQINDALITNAKIEDAAITSAKIGDLQVDTAKIADLAVDTIKVKNNAITTAAYGSYNGFSRFWIGTFSGPFNDNFSTISFAADSGDVLLLEATYIVEVGTSSGYPMNGSATLSPQLLYNGGVIETAPAQTLTNTYSPLRLTTLVMRQTVTASYTGTHTVVLRGVGTSLSGSGSYAMRSITLSAFTRRK